MFSPRDIYANFSGLMMLWGLGLGAILGAAFICIPALIAFLIYPYSPHTLQSLLDGIGFLLPYFLLCAFIGGTVGVAQGALIGSFLALFTHLRLFRSDPEQYQTSMMLSAVFLALGLGLGAFAIVEDIFIDNGGSSFFVVVPALISSCAAAFAARRVAKWYISAESNYNDFGGGHVEHS
jgi:hypothetical protein